MRWFYPDNINTTREAWRVNTNHTWRWIQQLQQKLSKIKPLLLRAMFFTALQQWPSKQDPQNYSSRELHARPACHHLSYLLLHWLTRPCVCQGRGGRGSGSSPQSRAGGATAGQKGLTGLAGIHDEDEVSAAGRLRGASGEVATTSREEEVTHSREKPCCQPAS